MVLMVDGRGCQCEGGSGLNGHIWRTQVLRLDAGTMINVKTLTGNMIQIDIDPNDKVMRIKVTLNTP